MSSVAGIFSTLDAPFVKFDRNLEPIVWQGKDILIHQIFDLKIPALCGSTIKYSFTTQIGDISFSSEFSTPGQSVEVVVQPLRVPSDEETIKGTFKTGRDGTFCLYFDNSYSWFNPKLLTYKICLYQPEFTIADNSRCIQSRRLLHTTMEDIRAAEVTFMRAQERCRTLSHESASLESRIAALTTELNNKKNILRVANTELGEMNARIVYNLEKKNGLCIRTLDKKLLTCMLTYLGKQSGAYHTCKYWKACVDDAEDVQKLLKSGNNSIKN